MPDDDGRGLDVKHDSAPQRTSFSASMTATVFAAGILQLLQAGTLEAQTPPEKPKAEKLDGDQHTIPAQFETTLGTEELGKLYAELEQIIQDFDNDEFRVRTEAQQRLSTILTPELTILLGMHAHHGSDELMSRVHMALKHGSVDKVAKTYPVEFKGYNVDPWIDFYVHNPEGAKDFQPPFMAENTTAQGVRYTYMARACHTKNCPTTPKRYPRYGRATRLLFEDWRDWYVKRNMFDSTIKKELELFIQDKKPATNAERQQLSAKFILDRFHQKMIEADTQLQKEMQRFITGSEKERKSRSEPSQLPGVKDTNTTPPSAVKPRFPVLPIDNRFPGRMTIEDLNRMHTERTRRALGGG